MDWKRTRLYPELEYNEFGDIRKRTMKQVLSPTYLNGETIVVYKHECVSVSKLIADSEYGDRRGRRVAFKDGNFKNCAPANLFYSGWPQMGEKNGRSVVNRAIADNIRKDYETETNISALSRKWNISRAQIYKILRNKVWYG